MSRDGKENAYPVRRQDLPAPVPPRLVDDVFAVLVKHGLPGMATPADFFRMRAALNDFLYTVADAPAGDVRTVTGNGVAARPRIASVAPGCIARPVLTPAIS